MTGNRDFKRLVRKGMAETGDSYTVARSHFDAAPRTKATKNAPGARITASTADASKKKADTSSRPKDPLSTLLSRALVALMNEAGSDQDEPLPTLAVWANVLQYIGDDGAPVRDLPQVACLSRRAVRVAVGRLEKQGYISVDEAKMVRLTDRGRRVDEAWRKRLQATERRWRRRFGEQRVASLRASLEKLVRQFELELPHYPTSYGTADPTITGGPGQEWPPVRRGATDTVTGLPLTSLLSQALAAITMEYERRNGPLPWSVHVVRPVGPKGISVPAGAAPSEKSGPVRHGFIVVDSDPNDRRMKRIRLTAMGARIDDRYLPTLADIEQEWRVRFGMALVDALRESLEFLVGRLEPGLPNHPPVQILWFDQPDIGFTSQDS